MDFRFLPPSAARRLLALLRLRDAHSWELSEAERTHPSVEKVREDEPEKTPHGSEAQSDQNTPAEQHGIKKAFSPRPFNCLGTRSAL